MRRCPAPAATAADREALRLVIGRLRRITQGQRCLEEPGPAYGALLLGDTELGTFWDRLDAARALAVAIQVRNGQLGWQPSRARGGAPSPGRR